MTAPFREAAPDEAADIAALINSAFQVERFFIDGDRTSADEVRTLMDRGSFLLSEEGGALAGCVYLERRGDRGYFGLLSVDPSRHGQGRGRALVAAAEARFREAGCRAVDITVVNLRAELPPFYRRLGYTETGTSPFPSNGKARQPCHFIQMSKPLEAPPA